MSFFEKLFGKKQKKESNTDVMTQSQAANPQADSAKKIIQQQAKHYQEIAAGKTPDEPVSEQYLINTFQNWFAPNKSFYTPGSPKSTAYFNTVNAARDEMIRAQTLFCEATQWTSQQLEDLINNPKPGITNMLICGLIFQMGNFAVIKDALYCVDFSTRIPNCIALYLLLTAQKLPQGKRSMLLDAGDGVDKQPLQKAIDDLKPCDPSWSCRIY